MNRLTAELPKRTLPLRAWNAPPPLFELPPLAVACAILALHVLPPAAFADVALRGEVVDARTSAPLPARVSVRGSDGSWHFPRSEGGTAVRYEKQRFARSVERHVTLSAHPFVVELPRGSYTIEVEHGKEYFPASRRVEIGDEPVRVRIALRRWIDMASLGWYSGDTHVHRPLEELPNIMLAEDLNVAFPLVHWVTRAFEAPSGGASDETAVAPIRVDSTHVIWPRNTEYEIFTVGDARHTLGAFFVLGHRAIFSSGVPPVAPIAERARRDGALIELDKHNWPWSMALVPVMDVDLFELSNNHVWRTEFHFAGFGEREAEYMRVERDAAGFTERGWIDFGLENYYALLDCGFRLRPTAGTASGVHPVPLGFGRVYVHVDRPFSYDAWFRGLDRGRSFVTTGPMMFVTVDRRLPGETFRLEGDAPRDFRIDVRVVSETPIDGIEIVRNGEARALTVASKPTDAGAVETTARETVSIDASSWIVVRCFESRPGGRVRFAHTAPFHFEHPERPLRPRREQVAYLIHRVESQIERSGAVLPAEAIAEYRAALEAYREIARRAR